MNGHGTAKREIFTKALLKGLHPNFCLFGGITFFLFLMAAATGYFLALYYVPSPDQAYDAVYYITYDIPMGKIVRGVHYWSANLMMVTILLHTLRMFIYGAYKKPRQWSWITGVLLLFLVWAFGFTGDLLPWDQKAYWATKVGTSILGTIPLIGQNLLKITRGGEELGALTLVRFYVAHVMFLPLLTVGLLLGHFFLIRKRGVSSPP